MRTILILDALTQTVYIDKPFTSGIIRAAFNDAFGLIHAYNVIYAYYGEESNKVPFKTVSLGKEGLKDRLDDMKFSGSLLNKEKNDIVNKLKELNFDMMIVHLHSFSSYIENICLSFNDIPKIFVIHDFIEDKFTGAGMMLRMRKIKSFANTVIISNSEFTQFLGNHIYKTRYKEVVELHPELKSLPDVNNNFIDRGFNNFVYTTQKEPIAFENNDYSVNIGRYAPEKGVTNLLNIHKYNNHKVYLFGTKDQYHDTDFKLYNRIKNLEKSYSNYKMCEGYSDVDLNNTIKNANNIVISCVHEGFGYTAFEAGLLGIPSIILTKEAWEHKHATSDYLQKCNIIYKSVDNRDKETLYALMKDFKLSLNEKKDISKKFIDYFTIEAFIKDRENGWEEARLRKDKNKALRLF